MPSSTRKYLAEAIRSAALQGDTDSVSELAELLTLISGESGNSRSLSTPSPVPAVPASYTAPPVFPRNTNDAIRQDSRIYTRSSTRSRSTSNVESPNHHHSMYWWIDRVTQNFIPYLRQTQGGEGNLAFTSSEIYEYMQGNVDHLLTDLDREVLVNDRVRWRNILGNALYTLQSRGVLSKAPGKNGQKSSKRWIVLVDRLPNLDKGMA